GDSLPGNVSGGDSREIRCEKGFSHQPIHHESTKVRKHEKAIFRDFVLSCFRDSVLIGVHRRASAVSYDPARGCSATGCELGAAATRARTCSNQFRSTTSAGFPLGM